MPAPIEPLNDFERQVIGLSIASFLTHPEGRQALRIVQGSLPGSPERAEATLRHISKELETQFREALGLKQPPKIGRPPKTAPPPASEV